MSGEHVAEFPGLASALDVDAVRAWLPRSLPELAEELRLERVGVLDVRYRPGAPCWILYRLKLRDAKGRKVEALLSARLLQTGESAPRIGREALARYASHPGRVLHTPTAYVAEAHLALCAFPIDSALPGLFDALDAGRMKRHLSRMWEARGLRVRDVHLHVLGYTPHARAAIGYEVWAEERKTGVPEVRRLIGKMHAKKAAARLFSDQWALWRARRGRIRMPPPVGYVAAAGLTFQERVRGERLGGLVDTPRFVKPLRKAARMLAALHGTLLPLQSRRKPADEAQTVERWAGVLSVIRPDLAPRVTRLRDRLTAEIESRARLEGPIHADFHHTNVLVDDGEVTIIDFDEMAHGDPMLDVGRFLASLRIPSLRAFGSLDGLAEAREIFLAEYARRAPRADEARARLFEAASLLIAAASAFRIQRPSWHEEVSLLLEEGERVAELARGAAVPAPARPGTPRAPVLSDADRLRWIRDPVYMQAVLDPYVLTAYGAHIASCRVREGRGAESDDSVSYDLRGYRGDEGWQMRLEGVTRHGGAASHVRRVEAVRAALNGSADAPEIPRPVAHLRPLAWLVREAPAGRRFASLLRRDDAAGAARRIARALAVLHAAPVELDERRGVEDELAALRAKLRTLEALPQRLGRRAQALLDEVERRALSLERIEAPVLGTLHPRHVLLGERVTFARVENVVLSHPLLDAGDFLARLALLGLRNGAAAASRAAAEFREAYAAARDGHAPLPVFEAAALLRQAAEQARKEGSGRLAAALVEMGEEALAR